MFREIVTKPSDINICYPTKWKLWKFRPSSEEKPLRNQYLAVRATDSADPYDRAQDGDYMSQLTWRALKASVSVCLSRVNFPAKAHRHHPVC
jgi:hypothetical protein